MDKGITFNIQKFSIHDGPGIRTTIFLKGCPLKCKWCANPESQLEKIQVVCDHDKCLSCQACLRNCPQQAISFNQKILFHYDKCIGCLQCVDMCPVGALSTEGEYKKVDEIVEICMQDIDFYKESNGGVTISGGEGMSQPNFLKSLVSKLKDNNLHVAIETTGYIKKELFHELAPMFDLLLFDVKHYDSNQHYEGTAVHNELIKENLKWAIENGVEVLARTPVIPGFNDKLEDAKGISQLLKEVNAKKCQLLPFHQFGEKKYELLDRNYELKEVKALYPEDLKDYQQVFINNGIDCFF